MKCYNCDNIISSKDVKCPKCNDKIRKADYELETTKKILNKIRTIKDFAHFVGMFYVKSYILLSVAILSIAAAFFALMALNNRLVYMILAFIFVLAFNYFLEMRKIEIYYKDFKTNKNTYYILWPFKTEHRSIICDANEKIPNKQIMRKRMNAYEKRDKELRILRFNSYKLFHPQKVKFYLEKNKFFAKHLSKDHKHYLQTNNYDDESYVIVEGTVHGFLVMDKTVVSIFNTPQITKQILNKQVFEDDYAQKDTKKSKKK